MRVESALLTQYDDSEFCTLGRTRQQFEKKKKWPTLVKTKKEQPKQPYQGVLQSSAPVFVTKRVNATNSTGRLGVWSTFFDLLRILTQNS